MNCYTKYFFSFVLFLVQNSFCIAISVSTVAVAERCKMYWTVMCCSFCTTTSSSTSPNIHKNGTTYGWVQYVRSKRKYLLDARYAPFHKLPHSTRTNAIATHKQIIRKNANLFCNIKTNINSAIPSYSMFQLSRQLVGKNPLTTRFLASIEPRRLYHDNIVEHYENPRNVGSFDKNDASVGTVRYDCDIFVSLHWIVWCMFSAEVSVLFVWALSMCSGSDTNRS